VSDDQGTPDADQTNDNGGDESGFTPPATQDDLNRIIDARLKREREKYADYTELQAKAAKLAEIEEANKTEQERQAERLAGLERELEEERAEKVRLRIASEYGIKSEHLKFLTGSDEDELVDKAKDLQQLYGETGKPRPPKPDPNQGRQSGGAASTADQFAASVGGLL
jgi:hypothetical protein